LFIWKRSEICLNLRRLSPVVPEVHIDLGADRLRKVVLDVHVGKTLVLGLDVPGVGPAAVVVPLAVRRPVLLVRHFLAGIDLYVEADSREKKKQDETAQGAARSALPVSHNRSPFVRLQPRSHAARMQGVRPVSL
jgi:hypothetical protein